MIVDKKYYRCGLAVWPPTESKWNNALATESGVQSALALAAAPASTSASKASSAPSQDKGLGKGVQAGEAGRAAGESELGTAQLAPAAPGETQ